MFNGLTGFWSTRALLTTVASQVWYDLSSSLTTTSRASFNDRPMNPTTLRDLDLGRPNWETELSTTGADVPPMPLMWAPAGLQMIAIWPADAAGNNSILMDGIMATPQLTTDAQYIDIGGEEVAILLDYCEHIACFKEGGADFQETMDEWQSFLKDCTTRNAITMASSKYRTAMGLDTARDKRPRLSESPRLGAR